jgi:hypothetical protein
MCYKQKDAGSRPDRVHDFFFNLSNPSIRTKPWDLLRFYQKWLPEAEEGFWRVKSGWCIRLISPSSVSRLSRQYGLLNISQPYRPQRSVTRIVLLFLHFYFAIISHKMRGGTAPLIVNLDTMWRSGRLHVLAARDKEPLVLQDSCRRSGYSDGKVKNSCPSKSGKPARDQPLHWLKYTGSSGS